MNYKQRSNLNSIIQMIILLSVFILTFWLLIRGLDKPLIELEQKRIDSSYVYIQGNTIKPISSAFYVIDPMVMGSLVDNYYSLIDQYDWDTDFAYKIMFCESSGNPNTHNFSHRTKDDSWGLFQINLYGNLANERPSSEWLLVPENNVEYAYQLYQRRGWQPWGICWGKIRD